MIYDNKAVLNRDKKQKRRAFMLTFLLTLCVLLLLYFVPFYWATAKVQDFEYGMAVSYGQDDFGSDAGEEIPIEEVMTEENTNEDFAEETENTETNTSDTGTPIEKKKESKTRNKQRNKNKEKKKQSEKDKNKDTGQGKGNDNNKIGDKGRENGVDERGLYNGRGGTGVDANIAGWRWESPPKVVDNSSETGKITFKVQVDSDGYIVSAVSVEPTTVSAGVVAVYKREILNLIFIPTADNASPKPISSGTITFVIKSK